MFLFGSLLQRFGGSFFSCLVWSKHHDGLVISILDQVKKPGVFLELLGGRLDILL